MWKPILAGAAALAIAGSSFVYAQQRDDNPRRGAYHNFTQEDRAAFTDARIAALRAGLRLTPEQEKNWPAFETALRDIAKARMDAREDWREARDERREARRGAYRGERQAEDRSADDNTADSGSVEHLRRQAERLSTAGANLKKLADAQEPLYQSLDDSQKNRFNLLSRILASHRPHVAQMRDHGREMRRMHERHHGGEGMRGMRERHHGGDGMRGPRGERGMHRGGDDNNTGMGGEERL